MSKGKITASPDGSMLAYCFYFASKGNNGFSREPAVASSSSEPNTPLSVCVCVHPSIYLRERLFLTASPSRILLPPFTFYSMPLLLLLPCPNNTCSRLYEKRRMHANNRLHLHCCSMPHTLIYIINGPSSYMVISKLLQTVVKSLLRAARSLHSPRRDTAASHHIKWGALTHYIHV